MISSLHFEKFTQILLVEDNPGDARLVEIYLMETSQLFNVEITHVVTLWEGIQRLNREKYDLVLLDLTLPDSRGFDTVEEISKRFPFINFIVLTGYSDREIGLKAIEFGAQDYLIKGSFDSEEFAKSINYAIRRHKILTELYHIQREYVSSQEKYKYVIPESKEPIFIIDTSRRKIIESNNSFDTLIELTKPELIGSNINEIFSSKEVYENFISIINLSGIISNFSLVLNNGQGLKVRSNLSAKLISFEKESCIGVHVFLKENIIIREHQNIKVNERALSKNILEKIAYGAIEDAFKMFIDLYNDKNRNDKLNTVINLSSQFFMLKQKETIGALSFEDVARNRAIIVNSLLDLLKD